MSVTLDEVANCSVEHESTHRPSRTMIKRTMIPIDTQYDIIDVDGQGRSDCSYHGYVATKSNKRSKLIVTESRLEELPIGTELVALNGTPINHLSPHTVSVMFKGRSEMILPTKQCSDCEHHGYVASKTQTNRPTTVTQSRDPLIGIGREVTAVDGIQTSSLSQSELASMFKSRQDKIIPTFAVGSRLPKSGIDASSHDAKNYAKTYDQLTRFQICALCGEECPPKDTVKIDECRDILSKTNIMDLYNKQYACCLYNVTLHDKYDVAYAKEIEYYLPNGLLRGESNVRRTCYREMKKKNSYSNSSDATKQVIHKLPKDALIHGLLPGHIPDVLSTLNTVEQSMISIYSSITKVSLHGGKNYSVHGALSYTIINDVTLVAKNLPRMPTIAQIAILRNENGKNTKDFTYRPYYVKQALTWLIENNHLYSDINLEWPNDHNWDDPLIELDSPFLLLSDRDIVAIDDNDINDGTA